MADLFLYPFLRANLCYQFVDILRASRHFDLYLCSSPCLFAEDVSFQMILRLQAYQNTYYCTDDSQAGALLYLRQGAVSLLLNFADWSYQNY